MCSLSFCRMEVHHGIRNARLQGDYSDYALTEPCPLRSTDDPSGLYRVFSGLKTFQGELWSHGPTTGESRQNGEKELDRPHAVDRPTHDSSIDPTRRAESIDSTFTTARSIPILYQLDRSHAEQASSIDPVLSQPFDQSRSDDITAVRSTWCKPT
ncbi:unnamed protein product [Microthlaspi erraticum]|uniref:Uncharacterized protein n=1 Tax=Microthlaspi erraticum TaxID=1685480 RepID=A0A6D2I051_9BRAS|nr:unnamed protein product [Microthlaspi erraticum]